MKETSKAHQYRKRDYDRYLQGIGIDIGCGPDPLVLEGRHIRTFDIEDGDAQSIESETKYDFAYSSHCLEHMVSVEGALKAWAGIIKQGGYLYLVVPDYVLYERMQWPSRYNHDHKASFSLFDIPEEKKHPTFYDLEDMMQMGRHTGLELVLAKTECHGYDFHLLPYTWIDQTMIGNCANCIFVFRKNT